MKFPISARIETEGMVYFARLCNKARLFRAGELPEDYHANLGKGMDLWCCQFLEVEYEKLVDQLENGASDAEALSWAKLAGKDVSELQISWWNSYMRNRGFRDDLSAKVQRRIEEGGYQGLGVETFFDLLDADEGRTS